MPSSKLRPAPCNGCTLCCQLETVPLTTSEQRLFKSETHFHDTSGIECICLAHDEAGNCVYLGEKGCSIWHSKPEACDAYDCLLWYEHFGPDICREHMHDRLFAKAKQRHAAKEQMAAADVKTTPMWRKGRTKKKRRTTCSSQPLCACGHIHAAHADDHGCDLCGCICFEANARNQGLAPQGETNAK